MKTAIGIASVIIVSQLGIGLLHDLVVKSAGAIAIDLTRLYCFHTEFSLISMTNFSNTSSPYKALEQAGADLLKRDFINKNCGYAYWKNSIAEVSYQQNEVHTLSMYLSGGDRTTRTDYKTGYGYQGAICILPRYSDSSWIVGDEIELFHFYFSDQSLRRYVAQTHDIEPSSFELPEINFDNEKALTTATYRLIRALNEDSHIKKEMCINDIYDVLLRDKISLKQARNIGGLSPSMNKKVKAYIRDHQSAPVTLCELSSLVGLSEHHLQKMFKQSNGISPHEYLMEVRINRAKKMLGTTSLSQISSECGFSHQSHLNRVFKQMVGITPLAYLNETKKTLIVDA